MVLWNLVPERWRQEAFIAGGYAACPALASDLDLWIFVDSGSGVRLPQAREMVLAHIRDDQRCCVDEQSEETQTQYKGVNVNILKVGNVRYGISIHVMVVDAPVNAVLEGFDISTHQIALLPTGEVHRGSNWTPVMEAPVVLIDTERTPARLAKIQERYGKS